MFSKSAKLEIGLPVRRYRLLIGGTWTSLIALFLWYQVDEAYERTMELAIQGARAHLARDKALRAWSASHGGVYVLASPRTPPNPYLDRIEERDLVTPSGRRLTLMNPTYMLRQFAEEYGPRLGAVDRLTSLDPLNPSNAPDAWERRVLEDFERDEQREDSLEEVAAVTEEAGEPLLRLMQPEYVKKSCLKCHEHQGYEIGDVRGAISVSLPFTPFLLRRNEIVCQAAGMLGALWLLGWVGLIYSTRQWRAKELESFRAQRQIEEERTFLQNVVDGVAEPIVVVNTQRDLILANKAAAAHYQDFAESCEVLGERLRNTNESRLPGGESNDDHNIEEVMRSGKATQVLCKTQVPDGKVRFYDVLVSPLRDGAGQVKGVIESARDVTERIAMQQRLLADEARLRDLAHNDRLTGLPNRGLFIDRLQVALNRAEREKCMVTVIFIDLDHFKEVNDSLGHQVGDEMLKVVSRRLQTCLRQSDTVARFGGDEFVILLDRSEDRTGVSVVAEKILYTLSQPIRVEDQEFFTGGSLGIAIYPDDGEDTETLLKNADMAMYQAKEGGRNNYRFFTPEMLENLLHRLEFQRALPLAVEREEFLLQYQGQFDTSSGRLCCLEALVRWQHPEMGLLSPNQFIPIAEDTGTIIALGDWVLRRACRQLRQWRDAGFSDLQLAVNVSGRQLRHPGFVASVRSALEEHELAPGALELELTESVIMDDVERTADTFHALHRLGVSLAIDDFGTGYSSMTYLSQFPLDTLKIDRSFVSNLDTDSNSAEIVSATIVMGHRLGMRVVAEGVESEAQRKILEDNQCDFVQGFLFGRPMASSDFDVNHSINGQLLVEGPLGVQAGRRKMFSG